MKQPAKPMPEFFISKEGLATFWFWLGMIAIIGSAFYTYRSASSAGLRAQFILMVPGNETIELLPPDQKRSEAQQQELHASQSRLLMDSVFNKSAIGLDAGERCKRLMSAEAFAWVQQNLVENQKDAFIEGSLHQKLTIDSIDVSHNEDGFSSNVTVKGHLMRIGVVGRQLLNQIWSVNTQIAWDRNTVLRDCGRFPLICTEFSCRERLESSVMRDLTRQERASLEREGARKQEEGKSEKKS